MPLRRSGHAVRRLTDESTNVHCTPTGRLEPPSGASIVGRPMPPKSRPSRLLVALAAATGSRPARPPAATTTAPWRCASRRRPPSRRSSGSRRSPPRTRPGSAARTRSPTPAGAASAVYPGATRGTAPAGADARRQRRLARGDRGRRAGRPSAASADPPHGRPGRAEGDRRRRIDSLRPTGRPQLAGRRRSRSATRGRRIRCAPGASRATTRSSWPPRSTRFATDLAGRPSQNVLIVSADESGFAMPAAAWAAKSGDAVLFTERDALPARHAPGAAPARAARTSTCSGRRT